MLQEAFYEYSKNIVISDVEQKEEFIGIYQTLEDLNHPIYIIGSDLLYTLPRWKNFDELMSKNKFYLIERMGYSLDELNQEPVNKYKDHFIISNHKFDNISSSNFRKNLEKDIVSKEVKKVINKYHLYEKGENHE